MKAFYYAGDAFGSRAGELRRVGRILAASVGAIFCVLGNSAHADVVPCTASTCMWTFAVGGVTKESGTYTVNPTTGAISITGNDSWGTAGGLSASVSGLTVNSDPILGFNFSAGTGSSANSFSFTVSMPIALAGEILANSSASYSLTGTSSSGAGVTPLSGSHVVTAFEESTISGGPSPLNKGVDIGGSFSFGTGPQTQNSPVYTAANMFALAAGNQYNEMVINVSFNLTASSNVGISGFVEQTPVPLPASGWLLLSGALGLFGLTRARTLEARV